MDDYYRLVGGTITGKLDNRWIYHISNAYLTGNILSIHIWYEFAGQIIDVFYRYKVDVNYWKLIDGYAQFNIKKNTFIDRWLPSSPFWFEYYKDQIVFEDVDKIERVVPRGKICIPNRYKNISGKRDGDIIRLNMHMIPLTFPSTPAALWTKELVLEKIDNYVDPDY